MPEPITSTTLAAKGGAMLTGGLMANLVIFNDGFYVYLAVVGAIVSMFGVLHEVLKNRPIEHTIPQIVVEVIKGLMLGLMAIPFWYLVLSSSGETIIEKFFGITVSGLANSLWLMVSFAMSWYTVPIYDALVKKITKKAKDA